jgi:hypothetical protein
MVAITGIGIMALLVIAGFGIMQDTKMGGVRQDTPESLLSSYAQFYNARDASGIAALIIPPQDLSPLSLGATQRIESLFAMARIEDITLYEKHLVESGGSSAQVPVVILWQLENGTIIQDLRLVTLVGINGRWYLDQVITLPEEWIDHQKPVSPAILFKKMVHG